MLRNACAFVHMLLFFLLQFIIRKGSNEYVHQRKLLKNYYQDMHVFSCENICISLCLYMLLYWFQTINTVKQIALCWNSCKFEHLDILGYFPVISSETIHICYNKGLKYSMSIIFKRYSKGEVCYSVLLYIYTYKIMNGDAYHWPHIQSLVQINKSNYILCILASKLFIILGGLFSFLCIK